MENNEMPNRFRWDGWVTLTWVLAGITAAASLLIVANHGVFEVPSASGWSTQTEINPIVWSIGIGQTIGAFLLAALFSMVNSIYKNSCDLLLVREKTENPPTNEQKTSLTQAKTSSPSNADGLLVKKIRMASQLEGILHPGFRLLRINGQLPTTELEAASSVVEGENVIEFINNRGELISRNVPMSPGPLHITFSS